MDHFGCPLKLKKYDVYRFKSGELHQPLDRPHDQCKKENQDGNLVDPMHHAKVEIGRLSWIRLTKNIQEIIPHLTQLEEFFDLVFF